VAAYLVDTNVLLRFVKPDDRHYPLVRSAVHQLWVAGEDLCYTSQNLAEFWNTCTRPGERNGYGLSIPDADRRARLAEGTLTYLEDSKAVHLEWRKLVVAHSVSGAKVHDARLVAAMNVHKVTYLLTFNTRDFLRYSEISPVHPPERGAYQVILLGRPQYLFRRRLPTPRIANLARLAHQIHGALHDEPLGAIERAHLLAGIGEQRKREAVLGTESRVFRCVGRIDSQHDHVLGLDQRPVVAEFAKLLGAKRGFVRRIKHQDDILPAQRSQRNRTAILIAKRELGRFLAHRQRLGKQPGQHQFSLSRA
jgi:predicted nucleic acid-binding protein